MSAADLTSQIRFAGIFIKSVSLWHIPNNWPRIKNVSQRTTSTQRDLQPAICTVCIWEKCSVSLGGFCGVSPFCWFPWQFSWRTRWTLDYEGEKNPSHLPTSRPLFQNQRKMPLLHQHILFYWWLYDRDPVIQCTAVTNRATMLLSSIVFSLLPHWTSSVLFINHYTSFVLLPWSGSKPAPTPRSAVVLGKWNRSDLPALRLLYERIWLSPHFPGFHATKECLSVTPSRLC